MVRRKWLIGLGIGLAVLAMSFGLLVWMQEDRYSDDFKRNFIAQCGPTQACSCLIGQLEERGVSEDDANRLINNEIVGQSDPVLDDAKAAAVTCTGIVEESTTTSLRSGWKDQTESALKNAATAEESFAISQGGRYTNEIADLVAEGLSVPDDITIVIASADSSGYCIEATHALLGEIHHYSSFVGAPEPGGC